VREFGIASDLEGLRLIRAFFRICDAHQRGEVIALVENLAKQSPRGHPTPLPQDNGPAK